MLYLPTYVDPIDRSEILSRSDPRDDCRAPGLIIVDVPGLSVNWTLRPDRRDVRRWYAADLTGQIHGHAAAACLLRELAARIPRTLGRRQW